MLVTQEAHRRVVENYFETTSGPEYAVDQDYDSVIVSIARRLANFAMFVTRTS